MDFTDVVRRRRMVRQFSDEPIAQESLDRILRNAVRGPSAGFSQGQAFLVLTGPDLERFWAVAAAAAAPSVTAAPLVIVPMSAKRVYLDRYAQPDKGWTDRDEARWPLTPGRARRNRLLLPRRYRRRRYRLRERTRTPST